MAEVLEAPRSWKAEVIADDSGQWCTNQLSFATREEAEAYGRNLARRWTLVRQVRAVESDEPVRNIFVIGNDGEKVIYLKDGE